MNMLKTSLLLAAMTAIFMGAGFALGGTGGMMIAFIIAAGLNFFSYWNSDKIVLRMYGAREVTAQSKHKLYTMTKELAARANLPMPKVYIIENDQPNAFATGRNPENAAVAATTGILRVLTDEELAGVMAHELAHIQNRDTLIMTLTATIAGALSMLSNFGFLIFGGRNNNNPIGLIGSIFIMIVAPIAAMIVQFAISRTREYAADRRGAEICGNPYWLSAALEKIENVARRSAPNMAAEHHPETAHLFIINPLSGQRMDNLFSTHPNTKNRIKALHQFAQEIGLQVSYRPNQRQTPEDASPWVKTNKGPWG